jgi:hypothetical protein
MTNHEKSVAPAAPEVEPPKVGQKLLFVRRGHSQRVAPEWLTVSKIGRRWVRLSGSSFGLRFDLSDPEMLVGEAGSEHCYGRCYRTLKEHTDAAEIFREWHAMTRAATYAAQPADMTLEKITEIRRLMGLRT